MELGDMQIIKKTIKEFFEKIGFEAEIESLARQDQSLTINIRAEEPQILIGERGETLQEIQHLLKAILRKNLNVQAPFYLDLDVNDYKKKKAVFLREIAKKAADEVALTKKEKELSPMSSYERRIVHLELAQRQDVVSESAGEGSDRRVVIRPNFSSFKESAPQT